MFTIDPNITDLKVKERKIFKILYSMNSHGVATPEMNVEEARCYILFFSEGSSLSASIGLYLPNTDRKFFYLYSANPFPYEALQDVEEEARGFAEDMGFLLDEIDVSGMSTEDRNRWIEEQYIFGYRKPEPTAAEEPAPKPQPERVEPQPEEPAAVAPRAPSPAPAAAPPLQPEPARVQPPASPVIPVPEPAAPPAASPAAAPAPEPVQPPVPQQPQAAPPAAYPQPPVTVPPPPQQPQVHIHIQQPAAPQPPQQQYPRQPAPQPKKPAPASAPHRTVKPAAPPQTEPLVTETVPTSLRPEDLIQEAVQSGVMKQPKHKLTRDIRSTTGSVSRDKEALARLMASF